MSIWGGRVFFLWLSYTTCSANKQTCAQRHQATLALEIHPLDPHGDVDVFHPGVVKDGDVQETAGKGSSTKRPSKNGIILVFWGKFSAKFILWNKTGLFSLKHTNSKDLFLSLTYPPTADFFKRNIHPQEASFLWKTQGETDHPWILKICVRVKLSGIV